MTGFSSVTSFYTRYKSARHVADRTSVADMGRIKNSLGRPTQTVAEPWPLQKSMWNLWPRSRRDPGKVPIRSI